MIDINGNMFPEIYNRMGATNPTTPMHEQIRLFRLDMREAGEIPVDKSAYLEDELIYLPPGFDRHPFTYIESIKNRARRAADLEVGSSVEQKYYVVFVWNINDVSMLSRQHMREIAYLRPDVDSMKLRRLVRDVSNCPDFTLDDETESNDVVNIEDAFSGRTDYLKQLASKYEEFKEFYEEISEDIKKEGSNKSIISHELLDQFDLLDKADELCEIASKVQEIHQNRWRSVKKSLKLVNRRSAKSKNKKYANLVISETGVREAAAQLLISGHAPEIPIENIYSVENGGVESVWERIQSRFGQQCGLIYVTSPVRLRHTGQGVRVWNVNANECIKRLYKAQRDHMLKSRPTAAFLEYEESNRRLFGNRYPH